MKRLAIISAILLGGMAVLAQVGDITTRWTKTLDACPPDMGIDLLMHDNALYWLSVVGSSVGDGGSGFPKEYTDTTASVYYDGELVATAARYEGASYNNNFNLTKTDTDGKWMWTVYSTSGDFAANNGGVAAGPDGSVYVTAVMRHTDNLRTEPIRFHDATKREITVDWRLDNDQAKRWWQGILMKVDKSGAIVWVRLIKVSNEPQPGATGSNADHTGTAFYITGMESDDEGNFFVAGRYANPISFQTQGNTETLTPHNTEGWDGDPQNSRGDLFVAKFDENGYLTKTLYTQGKAYCESSASLARAGKDLILSAVIKGTGQGEHLSIYRWPILLTDNQQCLLTVRLDTDLNVRWLNVMKGGMAGGREAVWQNNRATVVGDVLWLTGQGNGTLTSPDSSQTITSANGNVREGLLVKCDATTGEWLAGTFSKRDAFATLNGIVGYAGGFQNQERTKFYAYGYSFASRLIETDDDVDVESYGVVLVEHDAKTLEVTDFCSLISNGSNSTAQDLAATGNTLYTLSRGRDLNGLYPLRPINFAGQVNTLEWATVFSSFELPFSVYESNAGEPTGDIDGNGTTDVADLNIIINVILGQETHPAADVDGNGITDVADMNLVIDAILGL